MKIVQMLPVFSYGDAIGNDVIALYHSLKRAGYNTGIYAEVVDDRIDRKDIYIYSANPTIKKGDIILYHLSTNSDWNYRVADYKAKLVIVFHNVTPPQFFRGYDVRAEAACQSGWEGVRFLADHAQYCLADSEYDKQDLEHYAYQCPIDVLPVLIPFGDYDKPASKELVENYSDGRTNILFTGRIAPNKKQEDVIAAFYEYKKYYDPAARLFLVGSENIPGYSDALRQYVKALGVEDVYFPGQVRFADILAYYRVADLFLCMSEHEGFCVPLLEAMYFGIPILAYDSTAIGETLSDGGILYKGKKNYLEIAGLMNRIVKDKGLRKMIKDDQKKVLERYEHDRIEAMFLSYIRKLVEAREKCL